jgi:hypothetical protein
MCLGFRVFCAACALHRKYYFRNTVLLTKFGSFHHDLNAQVEPTFPFPNIHPQFGHFLSEIISFTTKSDGRGA